MKYIELKDRWFLAYPVEGGQLIEVEVYSRKEVDETIAELLDTNEKGLDITQQCFKREANLRKRIDELETDNKRLRESIGKLLRTKTEQVIDEVIQRCLIYGEGFVPVEYAMRLISEIHHQKYKRCLAMAKSCEYRWMNLEKMIDTEYRTKKMRLSQRWWCIWPKLAKKVKEASIVKK